ncbi:DUF1302 domain-containing protein [Chromobacterium sphagni]|uniref:DUF1302 domain-containing protein n=1 Tax=Chromobacterium sphagni TaxID=1903179 RepID=A0A1S1X6I4_9NEIS|nr:DUF1302 domain-containing protein [Chromobacterium sphagni]OHX14796.1 hypothetical protein BI347_15750 [Chromobacterium sphagni]OHX16391.1 hypothetical protein BI344_21555 [Chromobacterium sphagni]
MKRMHACSPLVWLLAAGAGHAGEITVSTLPSGLGEGSRFDWGAVQLETKGAMALGSVYRMENPNPVFTSHANLMDSLNDGDLNYRRGDLVSESWQGYLQGDLRYRDAGLFVSGKAWYDYGLIHDAVPHGHAPNAYVAGAPLNDAGFTQLGRFSGAVLDDAYVYGRYQLGQSSLLLRLGQQVIPWVTPTTILGGIQQVNAMDFNALGRSGTIPEMVNIPAPAFYAKLGATPRLTLDGYYQFKFEPNAYPACGAFYSGSDYAQPGCNKLTLNGSLLSMLLRRNVVTSDQQSAANPLDYIQRAPDDKPYGGEYGASISYLFDGVGQLGLFYSNQTSQMSFNQMVRTGPGVLLPAAANLGLAAPTGIAGQFRRSYPDNIHMFGVNFKTRLPGGTGIYSEFSYRPNQPVAWNGADFLYGVLTGTGPLGYLAHTPTGYLARGYDTFHSSQFSLGGQQPLGRVLGGEARLSGEVGVKYLSSLPDPYAMRYGRVGFGQAPSAATPSCSGTGATCALDGFVTSVSWGIRAKLEERYAGALPGLDLMPSLVLGYDVKGYSQDGQFMEGRRSALWRLQGEYRKRYVFELLYLATGGGNYNTLSDRSLAMVSAGIKF